MPSLSLALHPSKAFIFYDLGTTRWTAKRSEVPLALRKRLKARRRNLCAAPVSKWRRTRVPHIPANAALVSGTTEQDRTPAPLEYRAARRGIPVEVCDVRWRSQERGKCGHPARHRDG